VAAALAQSPLRRIAAELNVEPACVSFIATLRHFVEPQAPFLNG